MKRVLAVVCVVFLLGTTSLFAAGAQGGTTAGGMDIVEITGIYESSKDRIPSERPSLFDKELEKEWGIRMLWEDRAAPMHEYITVLMASDDHPKFIGMGPRTWHVNPWGLEGYMQPLEMHMSKVPNYMRQWTESEWEFAMTKSKAPDGHLYYFPNKNPRKASMTWIYRKSDFDKLGVPEPSTTAELFQILKDMKKVNPDSVGIMNRAGASGLWRRMIHSFRTSGGFFVDYDRTTSELTYGPTTEKFRDMMKAVAMLYAEGLVDPEFITNSYQEWTEKIARGQGSFIFSWGTRAPWAMGVETDPDAEWTYMSTPISHYEGKPALGQLEEPYFPWGYSFTDKISDSELDRMLEYMNWSASDEGWTFNKFGIEGTTFQYDSSGRPELMPHMQTNDNPDGRAMWSYGFGASAINLAHYWSPEWMPKNQGTMINDGIGAWVEKLEPLRGYDQHNQPWQNLVMNFSEDELTEYNDLMVVISQVLDEWTLKFVLGQLDVANNGVWSDFKKALEGAGLSKATALANEVFKREPFNTQM